jgi:acetyl esterase
LALARGLADSEIEVCQIAVPVDGGWIPAKLYRPKASPPTAALLWMHGGGFAGGSLDMPEGDAVSRALALAGAAVLNVGYRLVPPLSRVRRWRGAAAVRFPIPVADCLAAWRQLADDAESFGLSADRIFLGGASAGGDLAVMSALRGVDAGLSKPAGVLLAYPLVHAELPPALPGSRNGPSARFWDIVGRRAVRMMARSLVGAANAARVDDAFPRREELGGFPPTLIVTSERDPLRVSGEAFADDLRARGANVQIRTEEGTRHGHLNSPDKAAFGRTISTFTTWLSAHGT